LLNINADVAALELAKEIRPLKIIFLNTTGGMLDGNGKLINRIRLEEEFDQLMKQPWVKHGTRLKIKEFKACLDALPPSSTVSITAPEHLASELFDSHGLGTHITRGERVIQYDSLDAIDLEQIRALIENSFQRSLVANYFIDLRPRLHRIYLIESYNGVAILTKDEGIADVPYLDKFAVTDKARGEGLGDLLWSRIYKDNPSLFWRSRVGNQVNSWYFQHAEGHIRNNNWVVFWYGLGTGINDAIQKCVQSAVSYPASLVASTTSGVSPVQRHVAPPPSQGYRVGLLGARGHTGSHLIRLISQHPHVKLACASSSTNAGQPVTQVCSIAPADLNFVDVTPESVESVTRDLGIDAWFLALHDNMSSPYVEALSRGLNPPILIDLSSDHRFHPSWIYGQPEAGNRQKLKGAKRIANPGCYATGMYITLAPLVSSQLLDIPAQFFGVSGYSGAGTKPSPKNDPVRLADNLLPYTLVNHTHEREVTHQLGVPVYFTPHVASWFQGITLTGAIRLRRSMTSEEIEACYTEYYKSEPLVRVTREIPEVKTTAKSHIVTIGALEVESSSRRLITVTTLDNLLKGAATQAVQNLNLALNLEDELAGIRPELK
jgi:N-acetyl-gamma-glutamyl-phosphate reductase/acetylglutamate kinase